MSASSHETYVYADVDAYADCLVLLSCVHTYIHVLVPVPVNEKSDIAQCSLKQTHVTVVISAPDRFIHTVRF